MGCKHDRDFYLPTFNGVNYRMQHILFPIAYEVTTPTQNLFTNYEYMAKVEQEYIKSGTGFLTSMGSEMLGMHMHQ